MTTHTPNIFLSYSTVNTDIANAIDNDFKREGIIFQRDSRDITYRTSIRDFMNRIGSVDFMVMIISDQYLKSTSCMYEVAELLNTHEFEKRILPIVLNDALSIFNSELRVIYYNYWNEKLKAAKARNKKNPNLDHTEQVKLANNICAHLDLFFMKITDLKAMSFEDLKKQNYIPILNIIGINVKDNDKALMKRAFGIGRIMNDQEREIALEEFLLKYPNNRFGLFVKAHRTQSAGKYEEARNLYEHMLSIYPNFDWAHKNLADILIENYHDHELANKHYDIANRINPKYTQGS